MLRKTKIVCTLGPSTDDENVMRSLIEEGMTGYKGAGDPSERVRKRQGGAEERTDIYSDDGGYRGR